MLPDLMRTPRLVKRLCFFIYLARERECRPICCGPPGWSKLCQWPGRGNAARFGADPPTGQMVVFFI